MKRYARICALDENAGEEEFLGLGKSYLIKGEEDGGAYIYVDSSKPDYFIFGWQYEVLKFPWELTLGVFLDKLTEDFSVNLEVIFEDKATKIVSENYYSEQLKPYHDRVVREFAPDFKNDSLYILLEGEF